MSITDLNEALDKAERGILNFFLPRLLPGDPVAYLTGFADSGLQIRAENGGCVLLRTDDGPVRGGEFFRRI